MARILTPVNFTTSLDCCQKFMAGISGLPVDAINPLVGDCVVVYHDSVSEVWMKVNTRKPK